MPALLTGEPARPRSALPMPEQGVIEEARRRQRNRWRRRGLGALAVAGVAVLSATAGSGAPRVALGPHGGSAKGGLIDARDAGVGVLLSPQLDGGQYGWCLATEESEFRRIAGGGCGAVPTSSEPITYVVSTSSARARQQTFVALVTPKVRALLFDHRRVPAVSMPGLPYGLRVARITVPLTPVRSPTGRLVLPPPREPVLTALDGAGRVLASTPVRPGSSPATTSSGPCSLQATGLEGLRARWSHVAGTVAPYPGAVVGRAFFSCIDTDYAFHGSSLDVAILLDAAHPGSPPAAVPGLLPVEGDGAFVNGPGAFKGALTATRRGDAWLIAAGGSLDERIEVLSHIRAKIEP